MWYKLDGDTLIPLGKMGDPGVNEELEKQEQNPRYNATILNIKGVITVRVSTVFLRADNNNSLRKTNEPYRMHIFESMVFIDGIDHNNISIDDIKILKSAPDFKIGYSTVQGARMGHKKLVAHLQEELTKKDIGIVEVDDFHLSL